MNTGAMTEELFFKQQVGKGLQDVAEGRVITRAELVGAKALDQIIKELGH